MCWDPPHRPFRAEMGLIGSFRSSLEDPTRSGMDVLCHLSLLTVKKEPSKGHLEEAGGSFFLYLDPRKRFPCMVRHVGETSTILYVYRNPVKKERTEENTCF